MKHWLLLVAAVMVPLVGALVLLLMSSDAVLPVAAQPRDVQPAVFTSDVPITSPLMTEGFETLLPPTGWLLQQLAPGGQWRPTTAQEPVHSGNYAAIHPFGFDDQADSWLVTSLVTPTPASELVFWQYERYINAYERHSVYITTGRQDPKYGDYELLTEIPAADEDSWEEVGLDLGAYAGQPIYLAFRYQGTEADTWVVDDVTVTTGLTAAHSDPVIVGKTIILTATVAPGRNATFLWDLGDGTTETGAVITHAYRIPGAYTAVVTATNDSSVAFADTSFTVWAQTFLPLVIR